jgi:tRNA-dependent cyclodipeptide synthase
MFVEIPFVQGKAAQRAKFRARVSPRDGLHIGTSQKRCLYGLSLGASARQFEKAAAGYRWTVEKFGHCSLLLGDGLYRITLRICDGLSEDDATSISRLLGSELLWRFLHLVEDKRPKQIIRSSDLLDDVAFREARSNVQTLCERESAFAQAVRDDATDFVERQRRKANIACTSATALALSTQYLIEEITVYLLLAERGWLLDVYLGRELSALAAIVEGRVQTAPPALKRRVNVAIRPRYGRVA